MKNNYFIEIYTYGGKSYCDDMFFKRVKAISQGNPVHIVDNTFSLYYHKKLVDRYSFDNFTFHHLDIAKGENQYLRTVAESANYLRDIFDDYKKYNHYIIEEKKKKIPSCI